MEPRLGDIATFVAVYEAGGLSAAARRLNLAKSVVSKRLADLERAAGAELIRRGARRAQATEAGTAFYARAKHILAELDAALEETAGAKGLLKGALRVAAPLVFARLFLVDVFVEFARAHPAVELTLDCDDRLIDIRGGGYDLAIRISQLSDSALIARKLAPVAARLVASPDYLAARGQPASLGDLAGHDCIAYGNVAMAHQWRFGTYTVTIRPRLTVNNGDIMREAAMAGLGLAVLPLFMVADALADGRLVAVLDEAVQSDAAIYAVWTPGLPPSRKVRALIDLLALRLPAALKAAGALDAQ